MSDRDAIEAALRASLPADAQSVIPHLAQLLADTADGRLSPEQAQAHLASSTALIEAIRGLAGQRMKVNSKLISFEGAQIGGNISIGDVAGGDLIKLSIGTLIGTQYNYYTYATLARSPQEQRNRRAILTKVRQIWIQDLLERSLTDELRIDLNLVDRPDAVQFPLRAVVQELEQPPRMLSPEVPISVVFDQVGGELLILGAPGAGKTTLLLELLSDLLQRAEKDETHPIPIVFPLSTWAAEQKPLRDWLVDQLNVIYDVPRNIGRDWVAENEVLPLLDGLDEVAREQRGYCVAAINKYRQTTGGLSPVVVVSRLVEYETLKRRLRLRGAVLVEPLSMQQVKSYIASLGRSFKGMLQLAEIDPSVVELLNTPLFLNVATTVFASTRLNALQSRGTIEERKRELWSAYIERMFARKEKGTKYNNQQTIISLSWLASTLLNHSQTEYFIDQMQPNWLTIQQQEKYIVLIRVLIGAIVGISIGLMSSLYFWVILPAAGLVFFLLSAFCIGVSAARGIKLHTKINVVEGLSWSWRKFFLGIVLGISVGIVSAFMSGPAGPFIGLLLGWIGGILGGLSQGLSRTIVETRITPNYGIMRSVKAFTISWLIFGLGAGFAFGLLTGLFAGIAYGVYVGLLAGLVIGIVFGLGCGLIKGLEYGGSAVLMHYTLRYVLYRHGSLPFRDLIPWLDHCVERLFLRRVGGGYIFIHRMLMEHFSSMSNEDISRLSTKTNGKQRG